MHNLRVAPFPTRGEMAEEQFFTAWENAAQYDPTIVDVCRATEHEDLFQKTDAIIVCITGPTLKIQIKSYLLNSLEREELMHYGVIPLSILPNDSCMTIRCKTRNAITAYENYVKRKPSYFRKRMSDILKAIRFIRGRPIRRKKKRYNKPTRE